MNFASIIQGLLVAGIIGLYAKLDETGQDIAVSKVNYQATKEKIDEMSLRLNTFSSQPRFTKDDFQYELRPVIQAMDNINEYQKEIRERIRSLESNQTEMKKEIGSLKNKK